MTRITYMDEAGTSAHEPFAIVSAAIVHADKQLHHVQDHLSFLVEKHIPEDDRLGFIFHAKDIWQGTRFFKDREKWPFDRRVEILEDLVKTPKILDIPIGIGVIKKDDFNNHKNEAPNLSKDDYCHALAFAQCCGLIERFMRDETDENTILVVEDQPSVRAALNEVIEFIRLTPPEGISKYFPLKRIQEMPLFANKRQSPSLQIADMCAFFGRGILTLPDNIYRRSLINGWWSELEKTLIDVSSLGDSKQNYILNPVPWHS